jgi:hypothetical protein
MHSTSTLLGAGRIRNHKLVLTFRPTWGRCQLTPLGFEQVQRFVVAHATLTMS